MELSCENAAIIWKEENRILTSLLLAIKNISDSNRVDFCLHKQLGQITAMNESWSYSAQSKEDSGETLLQTLSTRGLKRRMGTF